MKFDIEQRHVIIGAALLMVAGAFAMTYEGFETSEDQIQVVATFYPLYDITNEVAGDNAEVTSLVPAGTDPHSFEPSPQDIQRLNNADIFVVTGAEFEAWETELVDSIESDVRVVDPSSRIDLIEVEGDHHDHGHEEEHSETEHNDSHSEEEHHEHSEETHHDEHEHSDEEHDEHHEEHEEHGDEHEQHQDDEDNHDHGRYDPHYWLSPTNAQVIAEEAASTLRDVDPENSETYSSNEEAYLTELQNLDSEYRERLSTCEKDRILTTHAAFSYIGQEYGFQQIPITGLSHLTEPTGQELQRLTHEAEEHGISHVFYDSMVDSSTAETIANEAGAEVLVLHSIEGAQERPYTELMTENLENLEIALQCQ